MLQLALGRRARPLLDSCVVPQCLRKPVRQARPVASPVIWRGWATGLHWRGTESAPGGRKTSLRVQSKNKTKEPETPPPAGPVATNPKGFVTIAIHAKPGSKQNAVTDLSTEAVGVAIAAPPSEGEANAELCRYLSKVLDLRKSDVVLDKGGKSREKVVKLLASTTPEEVLEKLRTEAEKK
ncbi:UPF0235 protein C15orf40 homolog isoform X1 [Apodemus sylvaticus]|uniref:UPF0235 protein C15orf40 homolog isoform X1 n=1 Tax=Apodemus sylvaticus TaxID=10129 RepID=UPI002241FA91|nr:UPF0235 protein C15orf40 homolog isoform X1 [Apodemus sylvaticus]